MTTLTLPEGTVHGSDWSWYRIRRPEPIGNTPLPFNLAIVCAVFGTAELENWKLNSQALQYFPYRAAYGAFRAYVTPEAAAEALVSRAKAANCHFVGLDFENYGYGDSKYIVSDKDIPYLVRWYDACEALGMPTVVYGSQSKMKEIKIANPAFYARMEKWVAMDYKLPTVDKYSIGYEDDLVPWNKNRLCQYSAHYLSGADYGILNVLYVRDGNNKIIDVQYGTPIMYVDGTKYIHKQPIDEWLGITDEPEEPEDPGDGDTGTTPPTGGLAFMEVIVKFLLWLLKLFGYDPDGGDDDGGVVDPPPEPKPEDGWPSIAKTLLGTWEPWAGKTSIYAPSDALAIYQVVADKAAVWTYNNSVNVQRPDGTAAKKYQFLEHVLMPGTGALWNIENGLHVVAFKKEIPTNPKTVWSKAYADGEPYVEILEPPGLTIRAKHLVRIGYFDRDGNWTKG